MTAATREPFITIDSMQRKIVHGEPLSPGGRTWLGQEALQTLQEPLPLEESEPRAAAARQAIRDGWSDPLMLRRALLDAIALSAEGPAQSIELQSPIRSARGRLREINAKPEAEAPSSQSVRPPERPW